MQRFMLVHTSKPTENCTGVLFFIPQIEYLYFIHIYNTINSSTQHEYPLNHAHEEHLFLGICRNRFSSFCMTSKFWWDFVCYCIDRFRSKFTMDKLINRWTQLTLTPTRLGKISIMMANLLIPAHSFCVN